MSVQLLGGGATRNSLLEQIASVNIHDDGVLEVAMQLAREHLWRPARLLHERGVYEAATIRTARIEEEPLVNALVDKITRVYAKALGDMDKNCRAWLTEGLQHRTNGHSETAQKLFDKQKVAAKVGKMYKALQEGRVKDAGLVMREEGFHSQIDDHCLSLLRLQISAYIHQQLLASNAEEALNQPVGPHEGDYSPQTTDPDPLGTDLLIQVLMGAANSACQSGNTEDAQFLMDMLALNKGLKMVNQSLDSKKYEEALSQITEWVLPNVAIWATSKAEGTSFPGKVARLFNRFLQQVPTQKELYEPAILFRKDKYDKATFLIRQASLLAEQGNAEVSAWVLIKAIEYYDQNASVSLLQAFICGLSPDVVSGLFLPRLQNALGSVDGQAVAALREELGTWLISRSKAAQ